MVEEELQVLELDLLPREVSWSQSAGAGWQSPGSQQQEGRGSDRSVGLGQRMQRQARGGAESKAVRGGTGVSVLMPNDAVVINQSTSTRLSQHC